MPARRVKFNRGYITCVCCWSVLGIAALLVYVFGAVADTRWARNTDESLQIYPGGAGTGECPLPLAQSQRENFLHNSANWWFYHFSALNGAAYVFFPALYLIALAFKEKCITWVAMILIATAALVLSAVGYGYIIGYCSTGDAETKCGEQCFLERCDVTSPDDTSCTATSWYFFLWTVPIMWLFTCGTCCSFFIYTSAVNNIEEIDDSNDVQKDLDDNRRALATAARRRRLPQVSDTTPLIPPNAHFNAMDALYEHAAIDTSGLYTSYGSRQKTQ